MKRARFPVLIGSLIGCSVLTAQATSATPSDHWKAQGNQDQAYFGWSVASAGDVNGDGFEDVIVGAYRYDQLRGRAFVYLGSASGLDTTPAWTAVGRGGDAHFGVSVATAGDVNGDGFDDVIVGASNVSAGQVAEGEAFVYLGSPSGLGAAPAWQAEGNRVFAAFGRSVASAGDVNGDGFDDVIVGAPSYSHDQTYEGLAFVYLGSPSGLHSDPAWIAEGNQESAEFGWSVGTAGDANGDGFDEVIVGAFKYDDGQTDEGKAFVYQGSATGLSHTADWTAESDQEDSEFGYSVATAGDVNGDGFDDVIVGAPAFDNDQTNEGRSLVYEGSPLGLGNTPTWAAEGDLAGTSFGQSVAAAGDVNGDGFDDVIVGAPTYENGQTNEGRAYMYRGSASGLGTSPSWITETNQNSADFGYSVGSAGDVNGDGFDDVIVGAPYYDNGQLDEGIAVVFLGRSLG